jgi:hypothetical protein
VVGNYVTLRAWDENETQLGTWSSQGGNNIPDLYVGPGKYTLTLDYYERDLGANSYVNRAHHTVTIWEKYTISVYNNFPGGQINIDGGVHYSGFSVQKLQNEGLSVGAINQAYNGYNYMWKGSGDNLSVWKSASNPNYSISSIPGATSRSYTYNTKYGDGMAHIIADLRKICYVTVQNNMSGNTNRNIIYTDDVPNGSPLDMNSTEGEVIKLGTEPYLENYMQYNFNHWEDGSTNPTRNITVSEHKTYTAYFKGTPIFTNLSLNVTEILGQPLILTWTAHQNPLVTKYRISRKVKRSGSYLPVQVLATIPSTQTSFEDGEYLGTNDPGADLVFYDIAALCPSEETYSSPVWNGPYCGKYTILKQGMDPDADMINVTESNVVADNSLENYPNPFNPVTQIKYSIKESGFVSLQIYDILGNKVADLVNEYKPSGAYSVSFDGSSRPSGIYICSIKANNYSAIRKILMVK